MFGHARLTRFTDFQPYYKVPSEELDTSDEVNKFASGYVEFNYDPKSFNFNHFRSAVDAYGGNDLIGGNFWEASIELEDNLDRMADAVPSLIGHVPDGVDSGDLVKTIKATFADLRTAQQNGWADFHPQSSTHTNTYWDIRILLSVPRPYWWEFAIPPRHRFSVRWSRGTRIIRRLVPHDSPLEISQRAS